METLNFALTLQNSIEEFGGWGGVQGWKDGPEE